MQSLFESTMEKQRKEMELVLGKEIMAKLKRTSLRMKDRKFSIKLVLFEDDAMLDVSGSFAAFSFICDDLLLSEKERNIVRDTINSVFIYISETRRVQAVFTRSEKGSVTFEGVLAIVRQTPEEKQHTVAERATQMGKAELRSYGLVATLGSGIFASYVANAMWRRQYASKAKLKIYLSITLGGVFSIMLAGARFYQNDFNSRNPWNGVGWRSIAGMLGGVAVGRLLTMGDDDNEHKPTRLDGEN